MNGDSAPVGEAPVDRPYTEQDVESAARALFESERVAADFESWDTLTERDRDSYGKVIRAVLDDLASRGRLRQPGDRPEWEVLRRAAAEMRRRGDAYGDDAQYGRGIAAAADDLEAFAAEAESRAGGQP